jgi:hypothetical protein
MFAPSWLDDDSFERFDLANVVTLEGSLKIIEPVAVRSGGETRCEGAMGRRWRRPRAILFSAAVTSPNSASVMDLAYIKGFVGIDYLHPNDAGYQAMANAFALDVFENFKEGAASFQ